MTAPNKDDLVGLDVAHRGLPFAAVRATNTVTDGGLDIAKDGLPFYGAGPPAGFTLDSATASAAFGTSIVGDYILEVDSAEATTTFGGVRIASILADSAQATAAFETDHRIGNVPVTPGFLYFLMR